MSARKLDALPNTRQILIEGRDFITQIRSTDGSRLTTIPLPLPGADPTAPWGHDAEGRVIAPYGIGRSGRPRKRMPGGKTNSAIIQGGYLPPVAEAIERRLLGLNCDPLKVLAEIALNPKIEAHARVKAASELCHFIYPKRRSVEHKGEQTTTHKFVIEIPSGGQLSTDQWLDRVSQARDVTPPPNKDVE
jgi:hypothetical protein